QGERQAGEQGSAGELIRIRADVERGRDRIAAGVDRQASIGLVAVDEGAVGAAQNAVPAVGDRGHDVEALFVEVAITGNGRGPVDIAAALLGHVDRAGDAEAAIVGAGDEVDHAADRVRAVNGR